MTNMTKEDMSAMLAPVDTSPKEFTPLVHWRPVEENNAAMVFLNTYDVWTNKLQTGDVQLWYDPAQHRVVFGLEQDGELYGAAGRALDVKLSPKWFMYHGGGGVVFRNRQDYITDTCVWTEDCVSACKFIPYMNAGALLGTNISDTSIPYFDGWERHVIALDRDASKRALELARKLGQFYKTEVFLLETDFKYWPDNKIKDWTARYVGTPTIKVPPQLRLLSS